MAQFPLLQFFHSLTSTKWSTHFGIFIIGLFPLVLSAQTPILDTLDQPQAYQFDNYFLLEDPQNGFRLNKIRLSLKVFIDETGEATLEDVTTQKKSNWMNFPFLKIEKDKTYWLFVNLKGSSTFNGQQLFAIETGSLPGWNKVDVFVEKEKGGFQKYQTGFGVPLSKRPFYFWANFFAVNIPFEGSRSVYIRLEEPLPNSLGNPSLMISHIDQSSLWTKQPYFGLKFGLIGGGIGIMFLYFLLLFWSTKDRIHLYFSLYLLSTLMFQFVGFRKVTQFILWPAILPYKDPILFLAYFLFFFGLLKYVQHYLNLKLLANRLSKWVNPLIGVIGGVGLLVLLLSAMQDLGSWTHSFFLLILLTIGIGYIFAITAGIITWRKNFKPAFYFLIAFAPILLSSIVIVLLSIFVFPLHHPRLFQQLLYLTDFLQLTGIVLLAFSMGYRTNILKEQQQEAERIKALDDFKNRFYTNISHEFRTPLTVIKGLAENFEKGPLKDRQKASKLIQKNSQQLLSLVNQMLDLSKLQTGKMKLDSTRGDIVAFAQYVAESFYSLASSQNKRLMAYSEIDELLLDFDEQKLQQILSNLLSNAIKYTPENGKIVLHLSQINSSENQEKNYLQIKVKDTGKGIAAEELPLIFERYYQIPTDASGVSTSSANITNSTPNPMGTGIGLALTQELVELMEGTISVKSQLNKGTEFTILLPIDEKISIKQPSPAPATASSPKPYFSLDNRLQLLIIEDNPDVVFYIKSCLQKDYDIDTASNGIIGIEKAITNIPDIIISDVMMPQKDGFEVCKTLKKDERTSHIPIILLTARVDPKSRIAGLKFGADAYLAKPFQKEELLVRLKKLVELRQRLQEKYKAVDFGKVNDGNTSSRNTIFQKNSISNPEPSSEDSFLQKILFILEKNYSDENFGLPELCKAMTLSRSQLFRKLKALTGKSTSHFIRSFRLQKAKLLLEKTDKTVSEIAFEVGFNNLGYFSKTYLEEFGVLPSDGRKN